MFLKLWYQVKINMSIDQKYAGLFWIVKLSIGKKFPNWFLSKYLMSIAKEKKRKKDWNRFSNKYEMFIAK